MRVAAPNAALSTTTTMTTTPQPTTTTSAPPTLANIAVHTVGSADPPQWVPAARSVAGSPAVWVSMFRAAPGGAVVGVARMDISLLRLDLYAGTGQPGGKWSSQGAVGPDVIPQLVAGFNSGFQFAASQGGWYADGRAGLPLRDGAASLVVLNDGSATVGQWGRDVHLTPEVVAVRQNLSLLIDGGAPVASVSSPGAWGAVLGGGGVTWRSGLGVDSQGELVYAGGPGLDPRGLAAVLVAAGVKRAMELDINPQWVLFDTFSDGFGPGGTVPSKLLAAMNSGPNHFFSPNWRDFVVVLAKPPTRGTHVR